MIASRQEAERKMRGDICSAIRRNLYHQGTRISRHQVVQVLATVMTAQLELIKDNAGKQRIDSWD